MKDVGSFGYGVKYPDEHSPVMWPSPFKRSYSYTRRGRLWPTTCQDIFRMLDKDEATLDMPPSLDEKNIEKPWKPTYFEVIRFVSEVFLYFWG